MTSPSFVTSGAEEHPEIAEISAFTEGLLTPERSTDVETHISGCPLCTDVRSSLDEIRNALGTLPGPPQMPDDIAGRIDAALAAEALLNATAPGPTTDVSRETAPTTAEDARPGLRGDAARRGTQEAAPPLGRPDAATGPGRQPPRRRSRRRTVVLSATGAIAALAFGTLFIPGLLSSSDDSGAVRHAESGRETAIGQPHEGGANSLTAVGLEEQVHTLLAKTPGASTTRAQDKPESAPDISAESSPTLPLAKDGTESIPACVQKGTERSEPPLAASKETYEGSAAYLIVLPNPDDAKRIDAYVIDASCVTQSPSGPGSVLATETFERR
jgi:hypothetical protein